jgi:hypothetical protein
MRLANGVRNGMPQPLDIFAKTAGGIASSKQRAAEQQQGKKFERLVHVSPGVKLKAQQPSCAHRLKA